MTRDVSPSSSAELALPPQAKDELDPELLALPDPPRKGRTVTLLVLAAAVVASLAMTFALRRDVAYAFSRSSALEVGELRTASPTTLAESENRQVRAEGMLGAAGSILYERPFTDDTFRALPVAGRNDAWVEVRVPAGKENNRWEPPRTFSGRLVRFESAGPRHRGLAQAIETATYAPVPENAWLLVDGDTPASTRGSAALAALFLGFAMWNVLAMIRLVRRVK